MSLEQERDQVLELAEALGWPEVMYQCSFSEASHHIRDSEAWWNAGTGTWVDSLHLAAILDALKALSGAQAEQNPPLATLPVAPTTGEST